MTTINENINKSRTLPSEFYTNDNIFIKTKSLFEDSVQLVCSVSELTELSVYPFEYFPGFLNEFLIITNQNSKFTCMPNVCTHRGHLLASCSSNNSLLQCGYHGRTFILGGELKNAPGFEKAENFPHESDHLDRIPVFKWNTFLFVSLNRNVISIDKLAQIDRILPDFPYLELKAPVRQDYLIDCHWTLYCDNYLEGFHIPYVHKGLNSDIDWKKYSTDILDEIVLQKAMTSDATDSILYSTEENVYAYYFFIFPNIMINYYKWGVSINIIEPISKEKTRVKYIVFCLKDEKIPKDNPSSLSIVESEAQAVVLSVQKGVKSRYYRSGRFAPNLEQGVHYFHSLLNSKVLDELNE